VTAPIVFPVGAAHRFLSTRAYAATLRAEVEVLLAENPGASVVLDFADVEAASCAFLDELVATLKLAYGGRIRTRGENPDVKGCIDLVVRRRGLAVCPRCGPVGELTRHGVCAPCAAALGWEPACVACLAMGHGQPAGHLVHVDTCAGGSGTYQINMESR
jgi:hypothetical protein